MWGVDFITLVLVLLGATHLGLVGLFNVDLVQLLIPGWRNWAYDLIGISALWQWSRQRFW
jgi:uncharacterized membrane protein YuzA (DUF378 family)